LVFFARMQVLNADTFRTVVQQEQLADKAYTSLESHFNTRANSTGIPAEVFMNAVDREALGEAILGSVSQAFDYLRGKTDSYEFKMDFTKLEDSVTSFFEEYADENGYEKDEKYEKKLASVIKSAESKILSSADTFKLSMMYEKGWLKTAKTYVSYLNLACTLCIVAVVFLLLLLILCNLKQIEHFFYWLGLAALVAGALLLTPCVYVTATDFFAGFTIKDPQIFSAVVGMLNLLTSRAMTMAIVTLVIALVLLAIFTFICGLRWEDEEVEERLAGTKVKKEKPEVTEEKSEEPEAAEETTEEAEVTEEKSEEPEATEEKPEESEVTEETSEEAKATEEKPEESEATEETTEEPEVIEETTEEPEVIEETPEEPEATEETSEEAEATEETTEEPEATEETPEEPEVTEEKSEESK
ncbi:MAG: hypothetical protein IKL00_05210, partial [Oscillospiraceae bacterium]|nr:hypothetical protein [Oscillospiraceae bacterium]